MTGADFDLLVELYLDGDLGPEERRDLLDAVRSDPERRAEFLTAVDETLRMNARMRPLDPDLCLKVSYILDKEKKAGTEVVEGVLDRLRDESRPSGRGRSLRLRVRFLAPVAACLVIAAGAMTYDLFQSRRFAEGIVARIEKTSAGVTIGRRGRFVTAVAGTPLAAGDGIETAAGGDLSFHYAGEETRVWVREKTSIRLEAAGNGKSLFLRRGKIEADVAPQAGGRPMAVLTPHAEMVVLGTVFSVTASEDATGLSVADGIVRMALAGSGVYEQIEKGRVALAKTGSDRLVIPGKLVRSIRITGLPPGTAVTGIAVSGDNVWVHGNHGADCAPVLACLDTGTGKVLREIPLPGAFRPGSCITWKEGLLWGFSRDGMSLEGVDTRTGAVARRIPLPAAETSSQRIFDIQGNAGWLRGRLRDEIIKIDLGDGRVLARVQCPFAIDRIAASEDAVYAGERGWNACRIDPGDGRIIYSFMCEAESFTGDMAIGDGARLWTVQGTEPFIHVLEVE